MIKIGKNKEDNWKIFDESSETDTLFHLDNFPSCYVIINKSINDLSMEEITKCANICRDKSKYHFTLKVFYTSISNLQKGDEIGSIIIKSNRKKFTLRIE